QKVPGAPRVTPRQPRSPLHRQIWERDQSRCTNCGSTYALEVDHILPKAKGGSDDATNLRLLCRSCNQRAAIREFGQAKMQNYLG
ncbi:MAG TPA: HNH endonuclease signature motif containing protein, partial [Bdellovibrionota bacterium]